MREIIELTVTKKFVISLPMVSDDDMDNHINDLANSVVIEDDDGLEFIESEVIDVSYNRVG